VGRCASKIFGRRNLHPGGPRPQRRYARRPEDPELNDRALEDLGRAAYVSLATFRRNGRAVETPVWIAEAQGRLYAFSEADAGKVKRLRNDPRVRLAPCGVRGRVLGPWVEGKARVVGESDIELRAYEALRRKYGWQMRLVDLGSWLAGRIDGRAVLEIEV
jgi:PPOX class probable F420-dependent enzyme